MSNFKSGSGNLDFGSDDDEKQETDTSQQGAESEQRTGDADGSTPQDQGTTGNTSTAQEQEGPDAATSSDDHSSEKEQTGTETTRSEYPYFVRRNNVGDERDTRLEIHVRDRVAQQEASFRNDVADHLDVSEISKTDAREFALLAAFEHPEKVAKLMEDEGFGTTG